MRDLARFLVSPETTLQDVMQVIDRNGQGIALVVDPDRRLRATITDGDLRRAILASTDFSASRAAVFLPRFDPGQGGKPPLTMPAGSSDAHVLQAMLDTEIRQVPILDAGGRVVDMMFLTELAKGHEPPLQAVIMAGGFGTRLRPLTDDVPKPMLHVGDRPLLEHAVEQLRDAGVRRVNVTTHYKGEVIARHFGDGSAFGVEMRYVREDEPLGTAGALGLLEQSDEPLLVMNGDILTRVNFRAMRDFHREHGADMTVAVRRYELKVPYGVIESSGVAITGISEKPVLRHFVSAGIYLLNPSVQRLVAAGQRCDMPDLIRRAVAETMTVVSFPVSEYWVDIGQLADYEQAKSDLAARKLDP